MEPITSKQRLTDGATFTVGQRVSFIDPQSGIYTDGVVVCFHGNDQVEVGYFRSGWSDPKYNRIVSIFTLLTIAGKPPRRSRQSTEAKSRPSSKNENAQASEGEGGQSVDGPKDADDFLLDDGSDTSPSKSSESGTTPPDGDCKEAPGIDKATDMSVESKDDLDEPSRDRDSRAGSPASASQQALRPVSACSSATAQEAPAPPSVSPSASPVPTEAVVSEPACVPEMAHGDAHTVAVHSVPVSQNAAGSEATAPPSLDTQEDTSPKSSSSTPVPVPLPSPRSTTPLPLSEAPVSVSVEAAVTSPPRIADRTVSPPAPAPVALPSSAPPPRETPVLSFADEQATCGGPSSRMGEQGSAFSSTSATQLGNSRPPSSQGHTHRASPAPQRNDARPSPSDIMMDPWEAARVMVELRDSFLRMGAASMLNAPPMAFTRDPWSQGVPIGMGPPYGMQMHMGMPLGHHMAMAPPAWQSLGMAPTSGDGPGPFKKRKW